MKDAKRFENALATVIDDSEKDGMYFDASFEMLKTCYASGEVRLRAASTISANATAILRGASAKLFSTQPELVRPGGNAHTARRYSACVRDMDYFLRYATYAMVAGDSSILDERVLYCLPETYAALGVPISATVLAIDAIKVVIKSLTDSDVAEEIAPYLDYLIFGLSGAPITLRQDSA